MSKVLHFCVFNRKLLLCWNVSFLSVVISIFTGTFFAWPYKWVTHHLTEQKHLFKEGPLQLSHVFTPGADFTNIISSEGALIVMMPYNRYSSYFFRTYWGPFGTWTVFSALTSFYNIRQCCDFCIWYYPSICNKLNWTTKLMLCAPVVVVTHTQHAMLHFCVELNTECVCHVYTLYLH